MYLDVFTGYITDSIINVTVEAAEGVDHFNTTRRGSIKHAFFSKSDFKMGFDQEVILADMQITIPKIEEGAYEK